jgi:hypothetical protein
MKCSRSLLALGFLLAFAAVACDRLEDPATLIEGGNALSSSEAARSRVDELETRTFTDTVGFLRKCSEFVSSLIIGSWDSDTGSWLLTFSATYEPGTRVFRFYEADSTFVHVAGPPLDEACGVE